jgi:LPXTG-motif cell wall-anchored protein
LNLKRIGATGVVGAVILAPGLLLGAATSASAGRTWTMEACVPSDAVTHQEKVIDVPGKDAVEEVSHMEKVVDVEAVAEVSHMEKVIDVPAQDAVEEVSHMEKVIDVPAQPAVAEVWANFSPNKDQGPFEGPPSFPTDERGTWHLHDKVPGGHANEPEGVYNRSNANNGRSSWFYKKTGSPAVEEVSHMEKVIDVEGKPAVEEVSHMEKVIDVEAVAEVSHMEKVIDVEGKPGVGEKSHMVTVVDREAIVCVPVTETPDPEVKTCADYAPEGNFVRGVDEEYTESMDNDGDGVACEKDVPVTPEVNTPLPKTGTNDVNGWMASAALGLLAVGSVLVRKFN